MTEHDAIYELLCELTRATAKHPVWPTDIIHQSAILAEEAGECVQASLDVVYLDGDIRRVREEAIQAGAMALRILVNMDGS